MLVSANARFCPSCGRPFVKLPVSVRATGRSLRNEFKADIEELIRTAGGMAPLIVDAEPTLFLIEDAVKGFVRMGIYAERFAPAQPKAMFEDGDWEQITISVVDRNLYGCATMFAERYHHKTGRTATVLKTFELPVSIGWQS
jgi:hypothetical protein